MPRQEFWDDLYLSGKEYWQMPPALYDLICSYIPSGGKLLEVGFWRGEALTQFHARGLQVTGIDQSLIAVQQGSTVMPWARLIQGDFMSLNRGSVGCHDAVFMKFLLALFPDTMATLEKCRHIAETIIFVTPVYTREEAPSLTDRERKISIFDDRLADLISHFTLIERRRFRLGRLDADLIILR